MRRSTWVYPKSHCRGERRLESDPFLEREEYPRQTALPKKEIIPLPFALFSPGSPPPALGLVGEEWSSCSGSAQVLWFVVLTKPTLLTPTVQQDWHSSKAFSTLYPHSEEAGEGGRWGGHTADPERPKG